MSYFNQTILASGIVDDMLVVIKEGLNFKDDLELRIQVPNDHPLFDAFNHGAYIYSQIDTCYFGTDTRTGQVSFFSYDGPGRGFGGSTYNLPMRDGSVATLIGPWSSRCGVMNAYGFTPSKEVTIESRYNMASAMTVEAINKLIEPLGYVCVQEPRDENDFDVCYHIVPN